MFRYVRKAYMRTLGVVALCVFGVTFTPVSAASASGPTVSLEWNTLQVGDSVKLTPNDLCPATSSTIRQLEAVVYSTSTSSVVRTESIGRYSATGEWTSAILPLWNTINNPSNGLYEVEVRCKAGGSISQAYDRVPFEIIDNSSSQITWDEMQLHGTVHIESVMPCPSAAVVVVTVYGDAFTPRDLGSYRETEHQGMVNTDSAGNWEYSVELFSEHMGGFVEMSDGLSSFFVKAQCMSSAPFEYDSHRFEMKSPQFVALGDSFSAGTGSFNSDINAGCYMSTNTYSYYVHYNSVRSLDPPFMQACHGYTTEDVLFITQWGLDNLGPDTEVVTLTIGGNDLGFESVLNRCANWAFGFNFGCSSDTSVTLPVSQRLTALAGVSSTTRYEPKNNKQIYAVKEVLAEIALFAENADIFIAGYPELFGDLQANFEASSLAPSGYICNVSTVSAYPVRIDFDDAQWMNSQAQYLNTVISNAVEDLQLEGESVHYISPSNFDGHGLCDSSTSWINGVSFESTTLIPPASGESFHPTASGYSSGYGAAFLAEID